MTQGNHIYVQTEHLTNQFGWYHSREVLKTFLYVLLQISLKLSHLETISNWTNWIHHLLYPASFFREFICFWLHPLMKVPLYNTNGPTRSAQPLCEVLRLCAAMINTRRLVGRYFLSLCQDRISCYTNTHFVLYTVLANSV